MPAIHIMPSLTAVRGPWWVMLPLLLAGCAVPGPSGSPESQPPLSARAAESCGEAGVRPEVTLHLQLVADMQREGLYHAALAHLDALSEEDAKLPRARFLRAESLRRSGDYAAARELFQGLTKTCLAGLGHYGLARIEVDRGRLEASLPHFAAAQRARPTDAHIRSDYGYALLLTGRPDEALRQFRTAYELGGDERIAANLLLALLVSGAQDQAAAMAERLRLSQAELARLRAEAEALRQQSTPSREVDP